MVPTLAENARMGHPLSCALNKMKKVGHPPTGMEGIVEIESQWTERRRERVGSVPVARAHPPANGAGGFQRGGVAHPPGSA